MPEYKILKLQADKIITTGRLSPIQLGDYNISYQIDLNQNAIYGLVVEEQLLMENCALFDQFQIVLGKEDCTESIREWLIQEFVIVDFTNIYKDTSDIPEYLIEDLISNGFLMRYNGREMHMLPFDKSGNMSRECKLSFINAEYLEIMNERLNLGIDFGKIALNLSKYYSYRGLYLSTAKRIQNEMLTLTPETLIIVDDNLEKDFFNYQKEVNIEEGVAEELDHSKISFRKYQEKREDIKVPFDGQGIISPFYADLINEELETKNLNSFQIRLPFAKGMLHRVDFHAFLNEFDEAYKEDAYIIKDVYGIERDLKVANIIMTKSMFKGYSWLKEHCKDEMDPMQFYCDAIREYAHALYISSTDAAYGNSKVTHISYQLLNTLKLSEEQFQSLIDKQLGYIHNPIRYIERSQGQSVGEAEDDEVTYNFANWQKAVLVNPSFARLSYIKNQLRKTQSALMTKLALGKLVVSGQTRYMSRDLPFMLVNLIADKNVREKLKNIKIFNYRFYLPQGTQGENEMGLEYYTQCGFFRSPHLSRNEQGLLTPLVKRKSSGKQFGDEYATINKYFGHLTGVVVFGNESLEPMALGGADFDGDLVCVITDTDVVDAIKAGAYKKDSGGRLDFSRKEDMPYIRIPSIPADNEVVPKTIPYLQIKNTFSNKIGLISNASIEIGQYEYGNKEGNPGNITCSQCTILTGLEIDAAKNGVHPDLTALTENDSLRKNNYLKFKKEFEKFRKDKDYHFNRLCVEKEGEKYILGLEDSDKSVEYTEEAGTFINRLPVVFMENINPKLDIPSGKRKAYFNFQESDSSDIKLDVFQEQCNTIFNTYRYYVDLFRFIQDKDKKTNYNRENLGKTLNRQYDRETVEMIKANHLPKIYQQFASIIETTEDCKRIEDKINQEEWHLLNRSSKVEFLKELLSTDTLNEDEWMIVLQTYNDGYRVLWYIIHDIASFLGTKYEDCKHEFLKHKALPDLIHFSLSGEADEIIRNFVKNKESGVVERLYHVCLRTLQEMVREFGISKSDKIKYLFEMSKNSVSKSRFFWDCFEWEELEPYIAKEEADA